MAKKKAARKTATAKLLRLRLIVDDDDPYSEIPVSVCVQCGLGLDRKRRGKFCYIRGEDAGWLADCAMQEHGLSIRYTQYWVPSFAKWLKSDQWPKAQAWAGGKWPKGSKWRDYR